MFTETELRQALNASADRADTYVEDFHRPTAAHQRAWLRPMLAASAAAALVVAAAVATTLTAHSGTTTSAAASPGTSRPAVATTPPPPASASASASADRSATSQAVAPAGRALVPSLTDLVQVSGPNPGYEIVPLNAAGGAAENVNVGYPPQAADADLWNGIRLVVLPPGSGFDPQKRFTDAQRTPIAGVSGWYGKAILTPPDGVPNQNTDKMGGPGSTLGYETSNGTWVFVIGDAGHNNESAATLRAAYDKFGATFTPGATLMPYKVGYLPAGLSVSEVGTGGSSPVSVVDWTGTGGRTLSIELGVSGMPVCPMAADATGQTHELPCGVRTVGAYGILVYGTGFNAATLQHVTDELMVATNLTPSGTSGWFRLSDALAG